MTGGFRRFLGFDQCGLRSLAVTDVIPDGLIFKGATGGGLDRTVRPLVTYRGLSDGED